MTTYSNEECKGCTVADKTGVCLTTPTNKHMKCPCMKCLVKVMCTDACEEWKEYIGYKLK